MLYGLIGCAIVIIILSCLLYKKQILDKSALKLLQDEIHDKEQVKDALESKLLDLQIRCNDARNDRINEEDHLQSLKEAEKEALERYHNLVDIKMTELDTAIEEQRQRRQTE